VNAPPASLEVTRQPVELGGRPGTVDPFEDDEEG
jgi:hypothetical protein